MKDEKIDILSESLSSRVDSYVRTESWFGKIRITYLKWYHHEINAILEEYFLNHEITWLGSAGGDYIEIHVKGDLRELATYDVKYRIRAFSKEDAGSRLQKAKTLEVKRRDH